jgi:hypothetical protein
VIAIFRIKLLKLVLLLPVATTGVERIFSIMNFVKNNLRSKMGQRYLNGCLVTFIERKFFLQTKDRDIITYFQAIKDRKVSFLTILLFYSLFIYMLQLGYIYRLVHLLSLCVKQFQVMMDNYVLQFEL